MFTLPTNWYKSSFPKEEITAITFGSYTVSNHYGLYETWDCTMVHYFVHERVLLCLYRFWMKTRPRIYCVMLEIELSQDF